MRSVPRDFRHLRRRGFDIFLTSPVKESPNWERLSRKRPATPHKGERAAFFAVGGTLPFQS